MRLLYTYVYDGMNIATNFINWLVNDFHIDE